MTTITTPILGVDLTAVVAGTGTSSDQGNDFELGTTVKGTDGQEHMYVHASAAIAKFDFVGIDENYEAAPLTQTMADDGWMIGIAHNVAVADNEFGWVAVKGSNINGNVLGSVAADVALYTSATAGSVSDTSSLGTKIDNVVIVTSLSTTATGNVEIIATSHPHAATF